MDLTKIYKNEVRIKSPKDVNRVLNRVMNGLLVHDDITEIKARTIASLANTMLKSFEVEHELHPEPIEIHQDVSFLKALDIAGKRVWQDENVKEDGGE